MPFDFSKGDNTLKKESSIFIPPLNLTQIKLTKMVPKAVAQQITLIICIFFLFNCKI